MNKGQLRKIKEAKSLNQVIENQGILFENQQLLIDILRAIQIQLDKPSIVTKIKRMIKRKNA